MRILFMADVPPDPDSGAAGTEYQTIAALRSLGHEVDALWSDDFGHRIRHGNLHYLLELPREYRRALRSAMSSNPYDVVHVNQPHGFLAAEWLARNHPSIPFVHRSHGLEVRIEREISRWEKRFGTDHRSMPRRAASAVVRTLLRRHTERTVRSATGHNVYATECRDFLVHELGVSAERVRAIPAAPPPGFVETPAPPMSSDRLRRVLHVSQFAFFKAPMVVARVMRALMESNRDLRFTWVCDARHHADVRQLLGPERESAIELLPWMPQDRLREVYDRCGVFLFASFAEGFGKVFLEAMSRGLVVVATDIAGPRDLIEDGRNGFLVSVGDVSAMKKAVERAIESSLHATAISEAASRDARMHTWEKVASETVAFYEFLCEWKRPARRR